MVKSMILTSFAILAGLLVLLPRLKNGFYVAHIAVVLLGSWWFQERYSLEAFHEEAIAIFLILHIISINVTTYFVYAYDKRAARRGGWRIAEKTLHAFGFIGGIPGAFLARKILRHKTVKKSFIVSFWITIILQIALLLTIYVKFFNNSIYKLY